jgi:small subunit ribosomal protein S17e
VFTCDKFRPFIERAINRKFTVRKTRAINRQLDATNISKVYVRCDLLMSNSISGLFSLGKVRTDTVKRISRELLKRFPDRFTGDFESDKQNVNDLVITPSKRLRNRIAGYITRLKMVEAERAAATQVAVEGAEGPPSDMGPE